MANPEKIKAKAKAKGKGKEREKENEPQVPSRAASLQRMLEMERKQKVSRSCVPGAVRDARDAPVAVLCVEDRLSHCLVLPVINFNSPCTDGKNAATNARRRIVPRPPWRLACLSIVHLFELQTQPAQPSSRVVAAATAG